MSWTFAGSLALLFTACAPPPSSNLPTGQLAVAVAVVCICGLVLVAVAVMSCVLTGPLGP